MSIGSMSLICCLIIIILCILCCKVYIVNSYDVSVDCPDKEKHRVSAENSFGESN